MKSTINSYVAVLIVTIFSSSIAYIIVDVGTTRVIADATSASNANIAALRDSLPRHR